MKLIPLSQCLDPETIQSLKNECAKNKFREVSFNEAMQFILTDGIIPRSYLPVHSFLQLEDWIRTHSKGQSVSYTATELKNKTGEILEQVLSGKTVRILKHGRAIAEIRKPID